MSAWLKDKISNSELSGQITKILSKSRGFYFPEGTDPKIKSMIIEYVELHEYMYKLAGSRPNFEIKHAAQKGFTVTNGSVVFRVLLKEKGGVVINFPNWRGFEEVLPLNTSNHFTVGSHKRQPKPYRRYEHGYYHSFRFKNSKEFISFFNKYVAHHAVE